MDSIVDRNLPDDLDSATIFSKVIGHKLSDGSRCDLYMRCRINFATDTLQTQTPLFMDVGFLAINTLDESSGLSTPATRIRRPMDGAHWSAPNHVFGDTTAVGVSE